HGGPAPADGDLVRPGLARRAAGQPGGDSLVEPGGGAAVAGRHRAGGHPRRVGPWRMAAGRRGLRTVVAAVRAARRQPAVAVVAAGTARACAAAGAGGRVLAPAAAPGAGARAGAAAVAAAALARPPGAGAWRGRGAGARRGAGPGRAG